MSQTDLNIADCLNAERSGCEKLVALLEAEQNALVAADGERLTHIVREKQQLVVELYQLSEQRNQLLQGSGRKSFKAWLAAQKPTSLKMAENWQKLTKLAALAKQLNEQNGKLISTQLQHFQNALQALQNAVAAPTGVYSAEGFAQNIATPRIRTSS